MQVTKTEKKLIINYLFIITLSIKRKKLDNMGFCFLSDTVLTNNRSGTHSRMPIQYSTVKY
jgi:hypothetical protein